MVRVLCITHADFETPGIIEPWAQENGLAFTTCAPHAGDELPSVDSFDWLISMGGPQSALDWKEMDYLVAEVELMHKALAKGLPILGFCLGAQLIGIALGAEAERSPKKEVGVFPITLTEEGKQDPLFTDFPDSFDVVHWHGDMPGLTRDSTILAYSDGCPRQIVRYTSNTYGFQCHLEPTSKDIRQMVSKCPEDLSPGAYIQSTQALLNQNMGMINVRMRVILDRLFTSLFLARDAHTQEE